MARQPKVTQKYSAQLTPDQMKAGVDRLNRRIEETRQFDPQLITEQYNIPQIDRLKAAVEETLARTFGADTLDYERYKNAAYFDNGPHNYAYKVPIEDVRRSLTRSKERNIALLQQAVETLQERLAETGEVQARLGEPKADFSNSSRIFIVHGHAAFEQMVARFLELVGFEPVILHEQANEGRTIIEKFERHSDVGFAVILLTDDDVGGAKGGAQSPRARQNVILELGYFIGRLGRARVVALRKGEIELPSDILGLVWENLDDSGAWQTRLAKELQAAGYDIDWNKVMR
jgi:predicted nucleotide-binding protein